MKLLLFLAMTSVAAAQGTISSVNRFAYAANAGWIDFVTPTPSSSLGVADTYLSGYAYAANFGYIHFGNGAPSNGYSYSNVSALDYGINISTSGQLSGYAYSPNIGWISFEQTLGQPRINLLNGQFLGFAYSANIGWISLDTSLSDLVTTSLNRPDVDNDGIPDSWEQLYFGNLTTANSLTDADGDGAFDRDEYVAGTLPTDAGSQLKITAFNFNAALNQATLTFTVSPTRRYRIEYDDDLAGSWTNSSLGTFTPMNFPLETRSLTLPTAGRRFYRPIAVQPF